MSTNVNCFIKFVKINETTGDWFIDGLYHFVPKDYLDKYGYPIPYDVTILNVTRDQIDALDPNKEYYCYFYNAGFTEYKELEEV